MLALLDATQYYKSTEKVVFECPSFINITLEYAF
jgi:hypothetical protein